MCSDLMGVVFSGTVFQNVCMSEDEAISDFRIVIGVITYTPISVTFQQQITTCKVSKKMHVKTFKTVRESI